MTPDEVLVKQVRDALQLKRQMDNGDVVLLDGPAVQKAFDFLQRAKVAKPIKRWSEGRKLWGLVLLATIFMCVTVALSILSLFRGGLW